MLPEKKGIFEPEGGFKNKTVYLVRVSMRPSNPVFECLLHVNRTSKSEKGKLIISGNIWANSCEQTDANKVYFMEPIKELCPLGA
jgi:hypothetical protein